MTHSTDLDKLVPALIRAQRQVKAAPRNATEDGKSFADLASVVSTANKALHRNKLALFIVGGFADITVTLLHESGQFLSDTAKTEPKANGETAYGVRWAYMRVLGMVEEPIPPTATERTAIHPRLPNGSIVRVPAHLMPIINRLQSTVGADMFVSVMSALEPLNDAQRTVILRSHYNALDIIAEAERLTGAAK